MLRSDLLPPHDGPGADPVLYGIAAALAELFPPILAHAEPSGADEAGAEGDGDHEPGEAD